MFFRVLQTVAAIPLVGGKHGPIWQKRVFPYSVGVSSSRGEKIWSYPCPSFPFFEKGKENPPKNKDFVIPTEPPEKEGKTPKKTRKSSQAKKNKEFPQNKKRKDKDFRERKFSPKFFWPKFFWTPLGSWTSAPSGPWTSAPKCLFFSRISRAWPKFLPPDVRRDIRVDVRRISGPKTYSLGWFSVPEIWHKKWKLAVFGVFGWHQITAKTRVWK